MVQGMRSFWPMAFLGVLGLLASCGDDGGGSGTVVESPILEVKILPDTMTLDPEEKVALTAVGVREDGSQSVITAQVAWAAVSEAVARVNDTGTVTAVGGGTTSVTATLTLETGELSASAAVTVTEADCLYLELTPPLTQAEVGRPYSLSAMSVMSRGQGEVVTDQADWTSEDDAVATVSSGQVTAVGDGTVTITAVWEGCSGSAVVQVGSGDPSSVLVALMLTPPGATLEVDDTVDLTVSGRYADRSERPLEGATWQSSDMSVVTVNDNGRVRAIGLGEAEISASFQGITSQPALIRVMDGGTVNPTCVVLLIDPSYLALDLEAQGTLTASCVYTDGSEVDVTADATWSSFNAAVADVVGGVVQAVAEGQTVITAGYEGHMAEATILVAPGGMTTGCESIILTAPGLPDQQALPASGKVQLVATCRSEDGSDQDVTRLALWASSDDAVAQVGNTEADRGMVTAMGPGSATISATLGEAGGELTIVVSDAFLSSLALEPVYSEIDINDTFLYAVIATYSDGSILPYADLEGLYWLSTDSDVATVVSGQATALAPGMTEITAATEELISDVAYLTVRPPPTQLLSVAIEPAEVNLPLGSSVQLRAIGTYSDDHQEDLTFLAEWTGGAEGVAMVSNEAGSKGLVQSPFDGSAGQTTVVASIQGLDSTPSVITVDLGELQWIEIKAENDQTVLSKGNMVQLQAMAVYSHHHVEDVTRRATWASSAQGVVFVSNSQGDEGLAWARSEGEAIITAELDGVVASFVLTVAGPRIASVTIVAERAVAAGGGRYYIFDGHPVRLKAMGTYEDGSAATALDGLTWRSTNLNVAAVDEAGMATFVAGALDQPNRTSTITAIWEDIESNEIVLEASDGVLCAIALSPAAGQNLGPDSGWGWCTIDDNPDGYGYCMPAGGFTMDLTATGTFLHGSCDEGTAAVTSAADVTMDVSFVMGGGGIYLSTVGDLADPESPADRKGRITTGDREEAPRVFGRVRNSLNVNIISEELTFQVTVPPNDSNPGWLAVTPSWASLASGRQLQLISLGSFGTGGEGWLYASYLYPITLSSEWSSNRVQVAMVGNGDEAGLVTALEPSTDSALVTARYLEKEGTAEIVVSLPTIEGVELFPLERTTTVGHAVQFHATALFTDGSQRDMTDQARWFACDTAGECLTSTRGSFDKDVSGLFLPKEITALNQPILVRAEVMDVDGTIRDSRASGGYAELVVLARTLLEATIDPADVMVPLMMGHVDMAALGRFDNGSEGDITALCTWESSNMAYATVGELTEAGRRIQLIREGQVFITARCPDGVEDRTTLTITGDGVVSITLEPEGVSAIDPGGTQQFYAMANFSDGVDRDVTHVATFSFIGTCVEGTDIWFDEEVAGLVHAGTTPCSTRLGVDLEGVSANRRITVEAQPAVVALRMELWDEPLGEEDLVEMTVGQLLSVSCMAANSDAPESFNTDITDSGAVDWVVLPEGQQVLQVDAGWVLGMAEGLVQVSCAIGLAAERVESEPVWVSVRPPVTEALDVACEAVLMPVACPACTEPVGPFRMISYTERSCRALALSSSGEVRDVTLDPTAFWESSDHDVATVDQGESKGTVLAVGAGNADITASYHGLERAMPLAVENFSSITQNMVQAVHLVPRPLSYQGETPVCGPTLRVRAGETLGFACLAEICNLQAGVCSTGPDAVHVVVDVTDAGETVWSSNNPTALAPPGEGDEGGTFSALAEGQARVSCTYRGQVAEQAIVAVYGDDFDVVSVSLYVYPDPGMDLWEVGCQDGDGVSTWPYLLEGSAWPMPLGRVYAVATLNIAGRNYCADVSSQAVWTSTDTNLVTVSSAPGEEGTLRGGMSLCGPDAVNLPRSYDVDISAEFETFPSINTILLSVGGN